MADLTSKDFKMAIISAVGVFFLSLFLKKISDSIEVEIPEEPHE